jgi:hypothetical protein
VCRHHWVQPNAFYCPHAATLQYRKVTSITTNWLHSMP